jgi:hypothetical protein
MMIRGPNRQFRSRPNPNIALIARVPMIMIDPSMMSRCQRSSPGRYE